MTFIEKKIEEFEKKLYPNAIFDGDDVIQKIYLQKKLDDYFEKNKSFLRQSLEQQKLAIVEKVEKFIDENDDGLWACRETADKIKEIIKHI